jgi:hypothetical protein
MNKTMGDVLHLFVGRFFTLCLAVGGSMFPEILVVAAGKTMGVPSFQKSREPLKKF